MTDMLVIRTQRPFFRSRPGIILSFACFLIALATLLLPYSMCVASLKFITLR